MVQLEAHVPITNPEREARLKLDAADHYPTLPVSRWTSARRLAQLVAEWIRREHRGESVTDRPLVEDDFEFRGGNATNGKRNAVLPVELPSQSHE